MSTPERLDDRIHRLAPEVDAALRGKLQRILRLIRDVPGAEAAINMMSSVTLTLFRRIYQQAAKPWPSDNLFDVLTRAGKGDPTHKLVGHEIVPDGLLFGLHTLRKWSNEVDHALPGSEKGLEEAEAVLNAFLAVLRWYYCDSGYVTPKLASLYAGASLSGTYLHDVFLSYPPGGEISKWVQNHFAPNLLAKLDTWSARPLSIVPNSPPPTGRSAEEELHKHILHSRCMIAIVAPVYFRHRDCLKAWKSLLRREELCAGAATLIVPILFIDDKKVTEQAKRSLTHDLSPYSNSEKSFLKTRLHSDFVLKMNDVARDVVEVIEGAPPWSGDWPIIDVDPPPNAPIPLPRM